MKKSTNCFCFSVKKFLLVLSCLIFPVLIVWQGLSHSLAVDVGSTTPGGTDSRLKAISDRLTQYDYRIVGDGLKKEWGYMWNRIYSSANWSPIATATVSDVASGKTFYSGGIRVIQTGQGTEQFAPALVPVSADPSKISLLYQSVKSKSYGLETSGDWGNWGYMWNRIYSASTWTPGDANAIPDDVALGKTFFAGSNYYIQVGTYVYQPPTGHDTTGPSVNAGDDKRSYVNIPKTFWGSVSDTDSGVAATEWSKQSGTGTVTFGSSSYIITTAKANVAGTYTIRLTGVDNAGNSNYDDALYIVHKTADYNNDGSVNGIDFGYMVKNWNGSSDEMADFNADGIVDGLDFALLVINWTV
jgi:hypothetical protein